MRRTASWPAGCTPTVRRRRAAAERALADRRMREINEAWQTLREPARRRRYDEPHAANRRPRASGRRRPRRRPPAPTAEDDDLIDVMGEMGPMQAQSVRSLPWVVLLVRVRRDLHLHGLRHRRKVPGAR